MARVYVGIGSNIERAANIRYGVHALREHYGELLLSPVYESAAVGFKGDNFYNLVAAFDTEEDVVAVVQRLRKIEAAHARVRKGPRFSSRTLDIDLLLYDDMVMDAGGLYIPRDEITRHAFVLCPLADIAGERRHPVTHQSYAEMWRAFPARQEQPLWKVEFDWG